MAVPKHRPLQSYYELFWQIKLQTDDRNRLSEKIELFNIIIRKLILHLHRSIFDV